MHRAALLLAPSVFSSSAWAAAKLSSAVPTHSEENPAVLTKSSRLWHSAAQRTGHHHHHKKKNRTAFRSHHGNGNRHRNRTKSGHHHHHHHKLDNQQGQGQQDGQHNLTGSRAHANRTLSSTDKIEADLASAAGKARPSKLERTVAFFGAVDTRPHLFLQVATLLSVHRFHPGSGFFVLLPEARVASWSSLVTAWSNGSVLPLGLSDALASGHFVMPTPGYSAMTFHRHRMPEMLLAKGFRFSVNLDPDVLCTRPWDLRTLLRVKLLGGRLVGTNARTAKWLQMLNANRSSSAGAGSGGGENVTTMLRRVLGVTPERLDETRELNGGVLVFNNSAAARVRWGATMSSYHEKLKHVVEGDQDLIGLIFAARSSFVRYLLPTQYNYAYRRDRERLPYTIGHRLRHGLVEQQVVNVHFVADGKPWQAQQLNTYPLWLLGARLHHLRDWLGLARAIRPRLLSPEVQLTLDERALLGEAVFDALRSTRVGQGELIALVDDTAHRRCRCFLRSLAADKKADALKLIVSRGTQLPAAVAAAARALVQRQRLSLLAACGGDPKEAAPPGAEERLQCDKELGARSALWHCAISQAQSGRAAGRSAAGASDNCTRAISLARSKVNTSIGETA